MPALSPFVSKLNVLLFTFAITLYIRSYVSRPLQGNLFVSDRARARNTVSPDPEPLISAAWLCCSY